MMTKQSHQTGHIHPPIICRRRRQQGRTSWLGNDRIRHENYWTSTTGMLCGAAEVRGSLAGSHRTPRGSPIRAVQQ